MEFETKGHISENRASSEISLGQLRVQVHIEKDGHWAIGVCEFGMAGGLIARIQGKQWEVLSKEFPSQLCFVEMNDGSYCQNKIPCDRHKRVAQKAD